MFNPQLKTFVTVADCGSFNQAAEKLYLSPPSVMGMVAGGTRLMTNSNKNEQFNEISLQSTEASILRMQNQPATPINVTGIEAKTIDKEISKDGYRKFFPPFD